MDSPIVSPSHVGRRTPQPRSSPKTRKQQHAAQQSDQPQPQPQPRGRRNRQRDAAAPAAPGVQLLPPHLASYRLQRRHERDYSGPGVLGAEDDEGSVEYKLRLRHPTPARFHQLVTRAHSAVQLAVCSAPQHSVHSAARAAGAGARAAGAREELVEG
jgi:hypothetical protein